MNKRAFNLFTALVAFVLIMLTVLLVQNMFSAERSVSGTATKLEKLSKLDAIAHVTRADALQIFNYYLRIQLETHLSSNGVKYGMPTDIEKLRNWEEIPKDYALVTFGASAVSGGGEQLAGYMALNIKSFFKSAQGFGDYSITLEDKDEANAYLKAAIKDAIDASVDAGNFFEVIGCDDGNPDNCPKGTFYVNFAASKISKESYELIPKIRIIDKTSNDTIKIGIIPEHDFKVYVPLRLFKALAIARDFALEYRVPNENNYGLFSPRIHNEIEEMALGFCDYDYCQPRTNPYLPPASKGWVKNCIEATGSNPIAEVECTLDLQERGICSANATYNTDHPSEIENALRGLVTNRICKIADDLAQKPALQDALNTATELKLVGTSGLCPGMAVINSMTPPEVYLRNSKAIDSTHDSSWFQNIDSYLTGFSGEYSGNKPDGACPMSDNPIIRGLGLYLDGGKIVNPTSVNTFTNLTCANTVNTSVAPNNGNCSEVDQIELMLLFEEKNNNYKVRETKNVKYQVSFVDGYSTFAPAYTPAVNSDCVLSSVNNGPCNKESGQGWYCFNAGMSGPGPGPGGGAGGAAATINCSPIVIQPGTTPTAPATPTHDTGCCESGAPCCS